MKRAIGIVTTLVTVALAAATTAGGATIPSNASGISSARIAGDKIVWFQRRDKATRKGRRVIRRPGPGSIFSRPLAGGPVTRVFVPPTGQRITAFKVNAGRLAIGLTESSTDRGPTSVAELIPGDQGWTFDILAARNDAIAGGDCGSRVSLLDIREGGEILVDDAKIVGLGGACEFVRYESTLREIGGASRTLITRRSGWADEAGSNTLPTLYPGAGDWYPQVSEPEYLIDLDGVQNIVTGERKAFTAEVSYSERIETGPGGQLLVRGESWDDGARFLLFPNSGAPSEAKRLQRKTSISWFHFCGPKIVEITRKPRQSARNFDRHYRWSLVLRDAAGTPIGRLKDTVPQGTLFDTCDAERIVFHKPLRKKRARQWVVPLNQ